MDSDSHSDSQIKEIFQLKNIAVVGLSKNEEKPSHRVPKYLIEHGYNVIPVNPTVTEVLGRKCYPSVAAINEKIDVVDVFRKIYQLLYKQDPMQFQTSLQQHDQQQPGMLIIPELPHNQGHRHHLPRFLQPLP